MSDRFLFYLLLLIPTIFVGISAKYLTDQQACPPDYDGPWGPGVKCPCENPGK